MRACLKRFGPNLYLYDRTAALLRLKVRMLKAEVIETLLSGCVTWTLRAKHFAKLQTAHHQVLVRVIGFQRRFRANHAMTRCDSTETTIRKRRLLFAGGVARL